MKLRALVTTVVLGAAVSLTTAPAHAQDNCPSFVCMSAYPTSNDNPGCAPHIMAFFSPTLYIYDEEGIDWPATALNRALFLNECTGVIDNPINAGVSDGIIAAYGMMP